MIGKLLKKQLQKLKELGYKNDYLDKNKFIKELTCSRKYALFFNDYEYSMKYALESTGYTSVSGDFDLNWLKGHLEKVKEDYRTIISIKD